MRKITIAEEQQIQLQILKYVDGICKQEHIQYFLAAGTLLGAVRDGGFIDWDDDVDIWMKRKEYDRFINTVEKYPDERYFIQNCKTDKYFFIPGLSRICVNNTQKWGAEYKNRHFHQGIYFDIFPMDYVGSDMKKNRKQQIKCRMIIALGKRKYSKILKKFSVKEIILGMVSKVIPISFLNRLYDKTVRNTRPNNGKMIVYFSSAHPLEKIIFPSDWFDEANYIDFEGEKYPVPSEYDKILTHLYGSDYMTPKITKPNYFAPYCTDSI